MPPTPSLSEWRLRRGWRRAYRFLLLLFHIVAGCGIAGTSWVRKLFQGGHYRYPPGKQWWMGRLCRLLRLEVRAVGEPAGRPVLLAGNHVSWLDIPVIGGVARTSFVSKAEIESWPVVGWMTAAGGTVFIPRGAHQATAVASVIAAHLERGESSILVFPEGTTTDGSMLRPFYPRLFAAVQTAQATVQPVALRYLHPSGVHPTAPFVGDEPFPSHLWRVLGERHTVVEVVFCQPFEPGDLERKALAERCRGAILAALGMA